MAFNNQNNHLAEARWLRLKFPENVFFQAFITTPARESSQGAQQHRCRSVFCRQRLSPCPVSALSAKESAKTHAAARRRRLDRLLPGCHPDRLLLRRAHHTAPSGFESGLRCRMAAHTLCRFFRIRDVRPARLPPRRAIERISHHLDLILRSCRPLPTHRMGLDDGLGYRFRAGEPDKPLPYS